MTLQLVTVTSIMVVAGDAPAGRIAWMRTVPRCRFCMAEVEFFGDLCAVCGDSPGFNAVAAADDRALATRMADAEMGDL